MRDLGITPQSSAVVTAIIALARALGLRVVAEGVETIRQMEVLHRLGCSLMQGLPLQPPAACRRAGALADRRGDGTQRRLMQQGPRSNKSPFEEG